MSYNIGQCRRSQFSSFSTPITYTKGLIENEDAIVTFYDPCLTMSGSNIVSSLYSYYLRFTVTQLTDSVQKFTVKLKNSEDTTGIYQAVKTLTVKEGTETSSFELIFHPNTTYNEVVFELSRLALDFNQDNGDGTSGRIMDITIEDFCLIENIIPTLASKYSGLTTLTKIGIQGPPGLLFVIDGEEIRIGRTGIYELYDDSVSISYIGFVIKESLFTQDGEDFFIMDFKY